MIKKKSKYRKLNNRILTIQIAILFVILAVSTVLFITEVFTVDKVAFLVMVSLLVCGLVTPEEAISGFSNPAVITILCLMIITAALEQNGTIGLFAELMIPLFKLPMLISIPCIMILVGGFSAFISTTAVVILFVKIVPTLAQRHNIDIAKYMIPISFAGILGGSCTLMGTSTNLIVNQIAIKSGINTIGFFTVTPLSVILLIIGIVITSILSYLLLTNRGKTFSKEQFPRYITLLRILPANKIIGKTFRDTDIYKDNNTKLLQIKRGNRTIKYPSYWQKFKENDELVISADVDKILNMKTDDNYELISESNKDDDKNYTGEIVEYLVLPGSNLLGKKLSDLSSSDVDGALPIALKKHRNLLNANKKLINENKSNERIEIADRLLIELDDNDNDNWLMSRGDKILNHMNQPKKEKFRKFLSLAILLLVIVLAASGFYSILTSALVGVCLLVISRCITLEAAYDSINWQIIFLLAGLLPIGAAMSNVSADSYISDNLLIAFQHLSPSLILSLLFLTTMLVSSVISNNATAIIFTPIAISLATGLSLSSLPFIVVIMLAANFSFFTPIGYQTNTIVYGMGIYKFKDFLIVGGILSFSLWIISSLLAPQIFPM